MIDKNNPQNQDEEVLPANQDELMLDEDAKAARLFPERD